MAILSLLSGLLGLVSLVCWVLFLIQLYKAKGTGHAVGGFCCALYTLYWGWTNADQLDAANPPPLANMKYKQLAQIWLGVTLGSIVVNVLAQVFARM